MAEEKIAKVLAAAEQVFRRHGYRRVTMGDIAEAARMSRPALYLVYPSKEEIFGAVLKAYLAETLAEIRAGLEHDRAIEKKLAFAFDVWCVRPYEMIRAWPEAGDLLDSGHAFATEHVDAAFAEFDAIVAQLLKPLVGRQTRVKQSAPQLARLMTGAALGFKQTAKDVAQLRQLLAGQIALVLVGLRS